jgi:hypothetical protein
MDPIFINANGTQVEREDGPFIRENNPHRWDGGVGNLALELGSIQPYTGENGDISAELDDYKLRTGVFPSSP